MDPLAKGGAAGKSAARAATLGGGTVGAGAMSIGGASGCAGGAGLVTGGGAGASAAGGGETAEAVAARLAREDARQAAKPKRPARDLAQGAGMHAAMGLADRRSVSNPSTASQPRREQAERRAPSAPTRAGV